MEQAAALAFFALSAMASTRFAALPLPSLFSDHAVLLRADRVPVWGKGEPGEKVNVTIAGARATTTADTAGRWRVWLNLSRVGAGPFDLVATGCTRVVISDVIVGEVWLCSGQSNLAWPLVDAKRGAEEIAHSANTGGCG